MFIFGFLFGIVLGLAIEYFMRDSLLRGLCSRDIEKIKLAIAEIRTSRDAKRLHKLSKDLRKIYKIFHKLEAQKNFDISRNLISVIRKLELAREKSYCPCEHYPLDSNIQPEVEAEKGHVKIIELVHYASGYPDYWLCNCSVCGTTYKCYYREYHAPWWEWKRCINP